MSDPQHAPLPDLPVSLGEDDQASLLSGSAEPTDDTPTIISRNQPRPPAPEEPFGPLRGRHLAHFELIEPIGVGGMAAVLRARDTQLDRFVALKILPPEMAADAENVRRFHQEARSAAKLDHENIARVFFCGEDQRLHFIAFEFVEGENLRTILERRGRLPVHESLRYLIQVAAGLAHASRRGVVHRDIKPSNIIITPNERAKLVDMGLARTLEPHDSNDLTQSGVTLGTFDYISPEQALEPRDADVRSDIYSLGCTFYHMLTGHPPVPEGTAAKKLHHHQHIQPTDPRLLVPDLPDEVAIILSRMMAKNPRDRYQSPEQLVHHLLLAARKLNVSADVPEGVLTLEAALPAPPASRPLLLATLAACAVVLLIFLLSRSTPPPAPPPLPPRQSLSPPKDKGGQGVDLPQPSIDNTTPNQKKGPPQPLPEPPSEKVIATAEELAEWLRNDKSEKLIMRVSGILDLSQVAPGQQEQGWAFQNRTSIEIVPDAGKQPAVIRLRYDGKVSRYDNPTRGGVRAALSFDNVQKVQIKGIRFQIDGNSSGVPMAAVWLRGGQSHVIQGCEFVQARPVPDEPRKRMAALFAEAMPAPQDGRQEPPTPSLSVEGCCFLGFAAGEPRSSGLDGDIWSFSGVEAGGHDALRCRGPLQVKVKNSAFGPHRSMFRVERLDALQGVPRLEVDHCSFRAGLHSAVYSLAEDTSPVITMSHSLVSADGGNLDSEEDLDAVLVHQAGSRSKLAYRGEDNRYYGLQGISEKDRTELTSQQLNDSPWQYPLAFKALDGGLDSTSLNRAFQVRAGLPELRLGSGKNITLAGAEQVAGVSYIGENLPPADKPKEPPARARTLIVNPKVASVQEGASPVYPTLSVAIDRARRGDQILIKHTGELKLEPASLNKASLSDLTIAAARGSRPVLTLGNVEDPDACLFRIHGGKLRLERLELRLQPGNPALKSQCVFSLMGAGQCILNDCVLTLDPGDLEVALAVAVLPDRQVKVDMPESRTAEQGPRLELNNCLVRGGGDLLWSRASRPAELVLKNTQAVLTGSVLTVKGGKEDSTPASGHLLLLQLDSVTTYLGGHLLKMEAVGGLKYLEQVECKANNCLFLAVPESDSAMIHLEGPKAAEKGLPDKVRWAPGRNAYGGFSYLLAQVSTDAEMSRMPRGFEPEQWKMFSGEADARSNAKLSAPLGDPPFTWVMPQQLTPEASLRDYGVQRIDQLPLPSKR